MDLDINLIKELRDKTQCGIGDCKKALELANLEIPLAIEILKYWGLAVNKHYPIGKIIRDYWINKVE